MAFEGGEDSRKLLDSVFNESDPRFSPDGRFLAYMSDESGEYEVYVQPFPGPGAKEQISISGGLYPIWDPMGDELFYQTEVEGGERVAVMAVDYRVDGDRFVPGKPRELFRGPFVLGPRANYDISPDGQRFVILRRTTETNRTPLTFVINWFAELERLVPTKD